MYILHIETSVKTCSVALAKAGKLIGIKESHPEGFEHSESLNLFIEIVLAENNITLKDLAAIAIGSGPGSYTGLRIGTASAKGFCYALDIPLISLNSLEIMIQKFANENDINGYDYIIPMIDARRMEVYDAIYDNTLTLKEKPSARVIDEDSFSHLNGSILLFGEGADKLININFKNSVSIHKNFKTSASGMCKIAYGKLLSQDFEDLAYFDPIYLKEFQAG